MTNENTFNQNCKIWILYFRFSKHIVYVEISRRFSDIGENAYTPWPQLHDIWSLILIAILFLTLVARDNEYIFYLFDYIFGR